MPTSQPAPEAPDSAVSPAATQVERSLAMLARLTIKARTMIPQAMFTRVRHFGDPKGLGEVPVFGGGKRFLF